MKFKELALILTGTLLAIVLFEVGAHFFYGRPWRESKIAPKSGVETFFNNSKSGDSGEQSISRNLGYFMTLHPYFGYALNPRRAGAGDHINSDGFAAADLPHARPKNEILVGISGGSTAAFCFGLEGPNPLEEILNQKYAKKFGKRFRVYNLALPGYRQPSVSAVFQHFSGRLHHFVGLVGFNEMANILYHVPLDRPSSFFSIMNAYGADDFNLFVKHHFLIEFRRHVMETSLLRNSHIVYAMYRLLASGFIGEGRPAGDFIDSAYPPSERVPLEIMADWNKYLVPIPPLEKATATRYLFAIQPFNFTNASGVESHDRKLFDLMVQKKAEILQMFSDLERESHKSGVKFSNYASLFENRAQLFRDGCHFFETNPPESNGCYLLAEKLAAQVAGDLP